MRRWMIIVALVAAAGIGSGPAPADWFEGDGYKMHYPQLPDPIGWDVAVSSPGYRLADDWGCTATGPVTDIHIWGSWLFGVPAPELLDLQVTIYDDLRPPGEYSRPGVPLWTRHFEPGSFPIVPYPASPPAPQGWYDPVWGPWWPEDHFETWQINLEIDPATAFIQQDGTIYWLELQMVPLAPPLEPPAFGWKTSMSPPFEDDAVYWWEAPDGDKGMPPGWYELYDPVTGLSLDLAFVITTDMDFGDAPDDATTPAYPTLLANDGARHVLDGATYLGLGVDDEADGQPTAAADGDDTDADGDDEDGVTFTTPLIPGPGGLINVHANTGGYLNGWIDLNNDGDWQDANEQIFTDAVLSPGLNPNLPVPIPAGTSPGLKYLRFRFDSSGGLTDSGFAPDGEVEDYQRTVGEGELLDFGDAPAPFPTLLASNGARHTVTPGVFMGGPPDVDVNGQPDPNALGDDNDPNGDDEDGVVFTSSLVWSAPAAVTVDASTAGVVDAWIDFARDNSWVGDKLVLSGGGAVVAGPNHLTFLVPATAVPGTTFARFRFSTAGGLADTGLAPDGEVEDYEVTIEAEPDTDFGDAPDGPYPTLLASNGARHLLGGGLRLGAAIDPEADGQPTAGATGDDDTGTDDEDGVVFTAPPMPGHLSAVSVQVTGSGVLNAWIDYNRINQWEASERIITNAPVGPGTTMFTFSVPAGAVVGPAPARFRLSTLGGLTPIGLAPDGEVEDYAVEILEDPVMDYGDAPETGTSYPTTLVNDGARHVVATGLHLGSAPDAEVDGQPTGAADGDDNAGADDEGGVVFSSFLDPGQSVQVDVPVTSSGLVYLNGWIDFNDDGDWVDAGEQVFVERAVSSGIEHLTVNVPAAYLIDFTIARFRLCSALDDCDTPTGFAVDGEVEDYEVMGSLIFADDFEDGTTDAWSDEAP